MKRQANKVDCSRDRFHSNANGLIRGKLYAVHSYYRCMFEIPLEDVEGEKGMAVTPFTKWSEIKLHLADTIDAEPVVIHRETKPPKNPFGATHAYGYQDIIFEVS
ncbi:unnamed protein product [Dibothriocephalus latus]|uniref:Uncharacterized protein n=1 Tax=Dibothriocephalus latus TaxID=60516 RepID=A0A3P7M2F1_DIBLA|nr:unnamed protein product [Dibothriocephalus latus]